MTKPPADASPHPVAAARPGLRLTFQGYLWLVIIALMLGVGIVKNINLLALLGHALLAILVLNGLVVGRRLGRLEARRVLEENLAAGIQQPLEVRLHNTSSRALQGVRIEDHGTAHAIGWYLDTVEGNARHPFAGQVVLPRRGWYDFAPLLAVSGYPFGLWERRVAVGPGLRVLVLPRQGKLNRERLRHQLRGIDPGGERQHRQGIRHDTAQADFHGLRPFRAGDSPRWIHWRTSARRGELMVREFEDSPGDDLVLVVERSGPAEPFEEVICLAATLISEWSQHRGDRLVLTVAGAETEQVLEGVTGPEHRRLLLEHLAQLTPPTDPAARPTPPADLLVGRIPHSAAVVLVTSGDHGLAADLENRLGRPVTLLSPEPLHHSGVYTPP